MLDLEEQLDDVTEGHAECGNTCEIRAARDFGLYAHAARYFVDATGDERAKGLLRGVSAERLDAEERELSLAPSIACDGCGARVYTGAASDVCWSCGRVVARDEE